ncbi:MAG: hypothetical protein JOZ28_02985 [Candidatus Eremiobacteraeota bacterium]|nr:hypothetical protein [Candidatus Eremiobacteraeota bacterium]MBV8668156.1 hypothetical protein [Candidatus Eremiobacteraeota bacterium]
MTVSPAKDVGSPSVARAIAVVVLGLFVLGSTLPNVHYAWSPGFSFGLSVRPDLVVDTVIPGHSADRAGVRVGDRLDPAGLSYGDLLSVAANRDSPPNQKLDVTFSRQGRRFTVHLVTERDPTYFYEAVVVPLKRLVSLIFVTIGALLVLLRPSRMTWWFYLFAIGSVGATAFVYSSLPPAVYVALNAVLYALYGGVAAAFLGFCVRFPSDTPTGWRKSLDPFVAPAYAIAAGVGVLVELALSHLFPTTAYGLLTRIADVLSVTFFGLGSVCLVTAYFQQQQERQRIKWLITGLIIGGVSVAISDMLTPLYPNVNYTGALWQPDDLYVLTVIVPITVAYAVLRYRVLDVNFFISRALVYATLTSVIVVVFALVDWFVVRRVVATNLGLIAEIVTAILIGFWLNALHQRIDTMTDRVFFRRRFEAEQCLSRIASALPYVTAQDALNEFLVSDPAGALDLASAALFLRATGGSYQLQKALGWHTGVTTLDANDVMILHLASQRGALRVAEVRWPLPGLPQDAAHPVLALPISVRGQLVGTTFYGAHKNGADLDPDEIGAIEKLAPAAAAAYDHLEAEAMRKQVAALQNKVEAMQALLAETQIQAT